MEFYPVLTLKEIMKDKELLKAYNFLIDRYSPDKGELQKFIIKNYPRNRDMEEDDEFREYFTMKIEDFTPNWNNKFIYQANFMQSSNAKNNVKHLNSDSIKYDYVKFVLDCLDYKNIE